MSSTDPSAPVVEQPPKSKAWFLATVLHAELSSFALIATTGMAAAFNLLIILLVMFVVMPEIDKTHREIDENKKMIEENGALIIKSGKTMCEIMLRNREMVDTNRRAIEENSAKLKRLNADLEKVLKKVGPMQD